LLYKQAIHSAILSVNLLLGILRPLGEESLSSSSLLPRPVSTTAAGGVAVVDAAAFLAAGVVSDISLPLRARLGDNTPIILFFQLEARDESDASPAVSDPDFFNSSLGLAAGTTYSNSSLSVSLSSSELEDDESSCVLSIIDPSISTARLVDAERSGALDLLLLVADLPVEATEVSTDGEETAASLPADEEGGGGTLLNRAIAAEGGVGAAVGDESRASDIADDRFDTDALRPCTFLFDI
jgi:hypothetical protein